VDRLRDQLLAAAGLAEHEHRQIRGRDDLDHPAAGHRGLRST
jgi:hypothetical protein